MYIHVHSEEDEHYHWHPNFDPGSDMCCICNIQYAVTPVWLLSKSPVLG